MSRRPNGPKIGSGPPGPPGAAVVILLAAAALVVLLTLTVAALVARFAPRCTDPSPPRQITLAHQTLAGCG